MHWPAGCRSVLTTAMYGRPKEEEGISYAHLSRYDGLPIRPSRMLPEMRPGDELKQSTIRSALKPRMTKRKR